MVWRLSSAAATQAAHRLALAAVLASAAGAGSAAWAAKAHEHGVARLDLGVEAGRITLSLEVPLEDLVGFERAPRSDAERAAVVAALARLQAVEKMVRVDAAAGCGAGKLELTAERWGVGAVAPGAASVASAASAASAAPVASATSAAPAAAGGAKAQGREAKDGHADLEARYEFLCSASNRAGFVEVGFFEAFTRLKRVEVQAVTPRGQMKLVLRRPAGRIGLAR